MFALRTVAAAAGLWTCFSVSPASAQIDYRNLDDDRPVTTEDAYPVEHHAFELLAPYRFEREQGGVRSHLFPLEVEYGVMDNTQIGIKAPIAGFDAGPTADTDWGLAGLGHTRRRRVRTAEPGTPGTLAGRAQLWRGCNGGRSCSAFARRKVPPAQIPRP